MILTGSECLWRATLQALTSGDRVRWRILDMVRSLKLPDCWVGAGFVRSALWDHLPARTESPLRGDVDIIWFDGRRSNPSEDRELETLLRRLDPSIEWSVKNQARMHLRNGDALYTSATDAMRYWPETATAVAVRKTDEGRCDVAAPLGLDDLFGMVLRLGLRFVADKIATRECRVLAYLPAARDLRSYSSSHGSMSRSSSSS